MTPPVTPPLTPRTDRACDVEEIIDKASINMIPPRSEKDVKEVCFIRFLEDSVGRKGKELEEWKVAVSVAPDKSGRCSCVLGAKCMGYVNVYLDKRSPVLEVVLSAFKEMIPPIQREFQTGSSDGRPFWLVHLNNAAAAFHLIKFIVLYKAAASHELLDRLRRALQPVMKILTKNSEMSEIQIRQLNSVQHLEVCDFRVLADRSAEAVVVAIPIRHIHRAHFLPIALYKIFKSHPEIGTFNFLCCPEHNGKLSLRKLCGRLSKPIFDGCTKFGNWSKFDNFNWLLGVDIHRLHSLKHFLLNDSKFHFINSDDKLFIRRLLCVTATLVDHPLDTSIGQSNHLQLH